MEGSIRTREGALRTKAYLIPFGIAAERCAKCPREDFSQVGWSLNISQPCTYSVTSLQLLVISYPDLWNSPPCIYSVLFDKDSWAPSTGFLQLFFSIDLPFHKSALQLLDAFPSPSSHLLSSVGETSSDLFLLLPTVWTLPPYRKLGLWIHLIISLLLGAMVLHYLFSCVREQLFHAFCAIC